MATELTPQQQFEDKLKDRLREQIGDLMPDVVLAQLVEKAVNEMFFTKRKITKNYRDSVEPSWFESAVERELTNNVQAVLTTYFETHKEEIGKAAMEALVTAAPQLLANVLIGNVSALMSQFSWNLQQQMTEVLRQMQPFTGR